MAMQQEHMEALAVALENCSCSGLRRTMRLITSLFDQAFEPIGLRCTQLTVLMAAAMHGPVPIRDLAKIVALEASSLSRALDPLERDGLLVREIGKSRRSRDIRITDAGLAKIQQAAPLWAEAQAVFVAILGKENMGAFEDILNRSGQIKEVDLGALKSQMKFAA
jgi:DNA-binding MarR family transcriptional regulator